MKLLIDAQLPKSLKKVFEDIGHDCIHTLDLPSKNRTTDQEINELSIKQSRIVISKDADFYYGFFQRLEPYKLLYISTGNISNNELSKLISTNLDRIIESLETANVVELGKSTLITIE